MSLLALRLEARKVTMGGGEKERKDACAESGEREREEKGEREGGRRRKEKERKRGGRASGLESSRLSMAGRTEGCWENLGLLWLNPVTELLGPLHIPWSR